MRVLARGGWAGLNLGGWCEQDGDDREGGSQDLGPPLSVWASILGPLPFGLGSRPKKEGPDPGPSPFNLDPVYVPV